MCYAQWGCYAQQVGYREAEANPNLVKKLKHGRRRKSIFRLGLDTVLKRLEQLLNHYLSQTYGEVSCT